VTSSKSLQEPDFEKMIKAFVDAFKMSYHFSRVLHFFEKSSEKKKNLIQNFSLTFSNQKQDKISEATFKRIFIFSLDGLKEIYTNEKT
jgi:hypothetical protein